MATKVLGLDQLQGEIDKVVRELEVQEQPAMMAAGQPILETWQAMVPVLDGNYRRALAVVWLGKIGAAVGPTWLADLERDEQPILYSKRLEFGDSLMPAQPSARPALEASRPAAIEAGAEQFRTVVRGRRSRRIPAA